MYIKSNYKRGKEHDHGIKFDIKESDLNKISINTKGRKKIRVDGTIYVETIEEEVHKLKELTHSNITIKDIVKKENTSGKRI